MGKKHCSLCGILLVEGNPNNNYGKQNAMDYISRHHAIPVRFKEYFSEKNLSTNFGITDLNLRFDFCYECHEEVLHNLVVNENIIQSLSKLFHKKSKQEKIRILHEVLKEGVSQLLNKASSPED